MSESVPEHAIWTPTPEQASRTRIARFMARHGLSGIDALRSRALADPEWFWDAAAREIGLVWTTPYRRVLDASGGIAWPRWFEGGELNLAWNCVDRHVAAGRGGHTAVIAESAEGEVRGLTYTELQAAVERFAGGLAALGVGRGDTVGVFLPLGVEAAVATLAITRLGAIYTPCFSGYGAQAVASRLADAGAKVLITADAFTRRGQTVRMKETADEAAALAPSVRHVVVARRFGAPVPWTPGRDVWWHDVVERAGASCPAAPVDADHPCLIVYTSGTTGRPKGTVLTQGGFGVKCGSDWAWVMDVGPDDRVFWLTDLGWLMGPMLITGTLLQGATVVMFDGTPDHPEPDRLWAVAARHRVSVMGFSPTAARALMPHGPEWVRRHDLSALRLIGSTGEPWNPEPFRWVFETVGQGRVPIMNYTGGTEISGGILASLPCLPIKPCSFAGPLPGMAADVYDEAGRPVRGEVGELVLTRPWPGMTRGFWHDDMRYEETYWSRWPGVWVHGDWARVDADGFWYLQGRSDDTLKVAGKRLGPAEVESVLVGHAAVAEAAAVGVPHAVKGEAIVCVVVLRAGAAPDDALRRELGELVAAHLGRAMRPERVLFSAELPKTRSAKILRRVIRATLLGIEPGDLSSLDNPGGVRAVAEAT